MKNAWREVHDNPVAYAALTVWATFTCWLLYLLWEGI